MMHPARIQRMPNQCILDLALVQLVFAPEPIESFSSILHRRYGLSTKRIYIFVIWKFFLDTFRNGMLEKQQWKPDEVGGKGESSSITGFRRFYAAS
jgi:hypothetical protein